MNRRCLNPRDRCYKNYGGRGITVCERWRNSFEAFYEDMGPRPKGASLDRTDNSKGYEPNNCRWATQAEQSRNKRTNRMITAFAKTMCLSDWAEEVGIPLGTLRYRLASGWPAERALTDPPASRQRLITVFGKTQHLSAWARDSGLSLDTLHHRLRHGWPVERALTEPVKSCGKRQKNAVNRICVGGENPTKG